jgi:DNA-binding transcriptional ArsR family regulator
LTEEPSWPTTSCPECSPPSPIRRGTRHRRPPCRGDATVGQLADPYDVSVQAVSKHVQGLTDAGLVSQRKDAQRRPCHLEAEVFTLMTKWIERYRRQAQERYERLDLVLAEMRRRTDAATTPNPQQGAAS